MQRDTWKSNTGFLLAAVGSAVGLGNIWRFSYVCHENGGGMFLIAYLIAMAAVGIPILILEFAIGHKMRASAPKSMQELRKSWEWLGWWPVLFVMFGIGAYYTVIIGWCLSYMLSSVRGMFAAFPWAGSEGGTEGYFFGEFLGLSNGPFQMGGMQWQLAFSAVAIWVVLAFIGLWKVDRGVELACKVFMPILALLTTVLVIWGFFLPGANEGLTQYITGGEDFSGETLRNSLTRLGDVQVWRDAFGQVFFSLSIGFGIMIAYASYLPPKTDLVKNAFITACLDAGYSIFAGLAVFSVLGFMAMQRQTGVEEVVTAGPGLCFVVYPEAISQLPFPQFLQGVFGTLFFMTLVLAGLTSMLSIVEAFSSAVIDKFGWERPLVVGISCAVGALGSLLFTTGAGLFWLDIVDHFLNQYGLILVGLLECILVAWYYQIDHMHFHLSDASEGGYPKTWDIWWEWSVTFCAPAVLSIILFWGFIEELRTPYEGYPVEALILLGLGSILLTFLASGMFSVYTRHREKDQDALGA